MHFIEQSFDCSRNPPNRDDWTRLRPRAEQLYRIEKCKINEVVSLLEYEYSVRITYDLPLMGQQHFHWLRWKRAYVLTASQGMEYVEALQGERKKVALRKLRKATQEGVPAPICEVHGRSVSLIDVKNHFRKKLPSGQTLDDVPTPSPSRAPTPEGFLLRSNRNSVKVSLPNHSLTRFPVQLSGAKKDETCYGMNGPHKARHLCSLPTLPVIPTRHDSCSYQSHVGMFTYSIRCPITSADNETALARTLAEIQYIVKIIPYPYQTSQDTFTFSRPPYEAQLVNHVWHLDRLAKS